MKTSCSSSPNEGIYKKCSFPFSNVLAIVATFLCALIATAGPTNYTWNVSSGNWSSPGSWTPPITVAGPASIDSVTFNNTFASSSPGTVNNTVDPGFAGTIANLSYTNFEPNGSYNYEVTLIPANKTLTVTNSFVVGGGLQPSGNYATFANVVGAGTLKVTAPSAYILDGGANGACAYLNLSGLTNFVYFNTNGTIYISDTNGFTRIANLSRVAGSLFLAYGSNNITVNTLNLGTSTSAQGGPGMITSASFGGGAGGVQNNGGPLPSGNPAVLTLGPGTNIINARTINLADQKYGYIITNSGSGGVRIRGISGADSDANVNITVGNRNVNNGTGQSTGYLMLNGCAVNIKANKLILGERPSGSSSGGVGDGGNGLLWFDNGTISANSLQMAFNAGNNNGTSPSQASGLIQVGAHGTFSIGAGQLFALATASGTGPATGTLIVSNGLINCLGPIVMGVGSNSIPPSSPGYAVGNIQLIGAGTLSMGPNSYIGSVSNPVTALILDTNSTLSVSIPAASYTNVCVYNLSWPSPDTNLTISVAAIPAGITNNQLFSFLNFTNTTSSVTVAIPGLTGNNNITVTPPVFNNPKLALPIGVTGNLSLPGGGHTIYLTITSGAGPGYGGVNQLANAYFVFGSTNWTAAGIGASIVSTNSTYPNTGSCTVDTRNIVTFPGSGTNVAKLTGSFVAGGSTNVWSQSVPVVSASQIIPGSPQITPGSQITMGCSTYVAHEDIMSGADSFYYEADFLDTNGNLIAAYESSVLSNLNCGSSILDAWDLMALTNQMQVTGGVNTGVVISNVTPVIQVPPQTATANFKAVFIQRNATDSGSVYFSGANIGFLLPAVPPTISSASPSLITLCTNTSLVCVATSSVTTISSVQVTATTTMLAGSATNSTVYTNGSTGLTITGLGTSSANISLALVTNTIYQSVVVAATDADGLSVTSAPVTFDTLTPTLVIEAADFNYSGGGFIDTPPNGGLALYLGQIGTAGIDENKIPRAGTQSYYRTNSSASDATIVQAANPASPSGEEQKFITDRANGGTNFEVCVGTDSVGDWQNYSRTVASSGGSIKPGTYNVWCYLATSGSGAQVGFYQVTNFVGAPNTSTQLTTSLGNFGGSTFSDNSFNNYVYAPLVDQFGNRVALTITNGVQTFRGQIINSDTPNVGFYMFVPVVPILTPVFLNVYPNAPFQSTNSFTFTVGPAQGAAISISGIGVTLNGISVNSGLTFAAFGSGGWTVTYPILSNNIYSVVINVTNQNGLVATYSSTFDTFNLNNFHWMAVDYDYSTNNGTSAGGSIGDGWTGGLFIDNPIATGDTNAPINSQIWELQTNSYFGYPTGFGPSFGPNGGDTLAGLGAVAHQSVDIYWPTNGTQDPGGVISNSIYRLSSVYIGGAAELNGGDGVGTQIASDSFLLPEFIFAQTNNASGNPDPAICEFNVGYFYTNNWLNYTRTFPSGTFNVWGRLAAGGGAFSGCTLSLVTSGVGTSNQTTQVLGSFADSSPVGWQSYHWIPLLDTNNNPVYLQLSGKATLRLTAPTNSGPGGNGLNPLFFMLAPAVQPASAFSISSSIVGGGIQIAIPTQTGHTYTLWYSAALSPVSWTQVGGSITGDGSVHYINQSLSGNTGFYQVRAQ